MTTALDWLEPAPCRTPDGVLVLDVGAVGWQVLVRDGALLPVWGDVAAPSGRPVPAEVRAGALRALVPPRAVVGRAGAVWVHAGGPAPGRFDVLVARRVRRPGPHPHRVPHECPLPAGDVVRLGPVAVTTVTRTAVDVARWLPPPVALPLLRRLADAGLEPRAALDALDRDRTREGAGRARATLEACTPGASGPACAPPRAGAEGQP